MSELRINKDLVSHIRIYDLEKTINYYKAETTKKYFFGLFKETEHEGYYWKAGYAMEYYEYSIEDIQNSKTYVDIDGILWRNPRIEIFAGKEMIKRKHFKTVDEAKNYATHKFPNVNIKIL